MTPHGFQNGSARNPSGIRLDPPCVRVRSRNPIPTPTQNNQAVPTPKVVGERSVGT